MLRKYAWNLHEENNLWILGIEGKERKTKGIDNLFNRIVAEHFPTLEKESTRCRKFTEYQTVTPKNKHPQTHHNQNTQHTE
jgi:hypothetical protein